MGGDGTGFEAVAVYNIARLAKHDQTHFWTDMGRLNKQNIV